MNCPESVSAYKKTDSTDFQWAGVYTDGTNVSLVPKAWADAAIRDLQEMVDAKTPGRRAATKLGKRVKELEAEVERLSDLRNWTLAEISARGMRVEIREGTS